MPASAATNRPEELIARLNSAESTARLKALREIKNQIIGNRTKKILYIKLGAVPKVAGILTSDESDTSLIVQSAAALGSFACGVDTGVRAVLDSGALPNLTRILSNPNTKTQTPTPFSHSERHYNSLLHFLAPPAMGDLWPQQQLVFRIMASLLESSWQVVDAGARSLRMIFQSKKAPKYDVLQEKNMEFLLSLLNSENENVTELAANIITHSCETSAEQKVLCDAGVFKRLISLLEGSLNQRDAGLDSLAAIFQSNSEVVSKFIGFGNGRGLSTIIELMNDRYPRTRLLSCLCLIIIKNASPCCLQEPEINKKMILILVELFEEPGHVGDEAPFALETLIAEKEDLQRLAFTIDAVEKLCSFLHRGSIEAKRLQGTLLALAELCSKLESCRCQFLQLKMLDLVTDALKHECAEVRTAACTCIRSISRSVKNLSAGRFTNEMIVTSLVQLLHDPCTSVQVAALAAICNLVVDFTARKSVFINCGGVKQLVHLSKSMDLILRLNAVWALRNLMFVADKIRKEGILLELTVSTLESLIRDPEPVIQEQALALVRNLVDGCINSIELVFAEDGTIINAVARQVWSASRTEVCIQGMYVLSNIATGKELHKEAVMHHILQPQADGCTTSVIIRFLQGNDSQLRTAALWCIVNLTFPDSHGASARVMKLRNAGIISQIKNMHNDSCSDVKFRVRTALEQCTTFGNSSM